MEFCICCFNQVVWSSLIALLTNLYQTSGIYHTFVRLPKWFCSFNYFCFNESSYISYIRNSHFYWNCIFGHVYGDQSLAGALHVLWKSRNGAVADSNIYLLLA